MSLSRYAPQLGQALRLPVEQPRAFLLIAAPWFALLLLSRSLGPDQGLLTLALDTLALGCLGTNWQRFVADPGGFRPALSMMIGPRHLAWGIAMQIFYYFESVPALFLSLALQDSPNSMPIMLAAKQAFQLLIGGMLLMLPHIALKIRGDGTTPLQSMVLKGGVAVGLGYVLTQLPFVFLAESLNGFAASGDLPPLLLTAGYGMMSVLNVTITSGYFVLVWLALRTPGEAQT